MSIETTGALSESQPRSAGGEALSRSPHSFGSAFPIVAIGASAGGLDAARKLFVALPGDLPIAVILVQHLEPNRESMMVDLLSDHTSMTVQEAVDGVPIERGHVYLIPPGSYISIANGALSVSESVTGIGNRLPFDHLLNSLAATSGERAICVVLTGTGSDGSLGLLAVKARGGLIIAQDPDEAEHGGMPRSAISTGGVDLVLPLSGIGPAIAERARDLGQRAAGARVPDAMKEIVDLLRTRTPHDFTLYKQGTLRRRVERRMSMTLGSSATMSGYLELLKEDHGETALLAKDLLIHVTSFFRDPDTFRCLAETVIPDLVAAADRARPLRIWIAGCSTGEESYGLAMLFREAIDRAGTGLKLQVFASDVDPGAVATAREGLYPKSIEAEVSPERLRRFFTQEDGGYRVSPELRALVVFAVQDVLADPPFSTIDFASCRNLMIYLEQEAQAKLVLIFHFAVRDGGVLLLGNAETIGNSDGRFETLSKPHRLYRRTGRDRSGALNMAWPPGEAGRNPTPPAQASVAPRHGQLADLCRKVVADTYGPASVLINRRNMCLYSIGPTDAYLSVPAGQPTTDLMTLARAGIRTALRSAIHGAIETGARVLVACSRLELEPGQAPVTISAQPVESEGEQLILVSFLPDAEPARPLDQIAPAGDLPDGELERLLAAARAELQGAIRSLEISAEEQRVINEEALSVNEEYQSTNEELHTSKEELQSLNEELTALNGQLQETLERQRTTSDDLRNILDSTDLATLFLDANLNIRFFTPTTRALFSVIPGDIGRPLADLQSLADDDALLDDARAVMETQISIERDIRTRNGSWHMRRVLPYRTKNDDTEGVVITFADITENRRAAEALEASRREAETATVAKSRFLASVSHDLRQPLQTLALVQGLLTKTSPDDNQTQLLARFDDALVAMSGMLNTLLDINQIEAGILSPTTSSFSVSQLLDRMRDEFAYHAEARRLAFHTVSSSAHVLSDPRLLEQVVRNLLSNALKYTSKGKVLLGCRRKGDVLSIEVWDTGVGIPAKELRAIFDEYHQLDNAARERSRGLGLGLSISQRLCDLLGHRIRVSSRPGSGSMFAVEVPLVSPGPDRQGATRPSENGQDVVSFEPVDGAILIIEDDPELRQLLDLMFVQEGYRTCSAADGVAALDLVVRGIFRPDVILADYNLPNGMDGLEAAVRLREHLDAQTPVVVLTGDISTDTLRDIALQNCVQLHKPVKLRELTRIIRSMLSGKSSNSLPPIDSGDDGNGPVVYVIDDDGTIRTSIADVFQSQGRAVRTFASSEQFLASYRPGAAGCLLVDAYLPGMSGLDLVQHLHEQNDALPAIIITGRSDVSMAVRGMKAGALDFLEKPVGRDELLASVDRALELARDLSQRLARRATAASQIAGLTSRQREIMDMVLAGHPSKNIASDLGISQRTVENHRASIMKRTGSKSLPSLARLALLASRDAGELPAALRPVGTDRPPVLEFSPETGSLPPARSG